MERINLSDFKSISKFKFVNGMFNKVEKKLEDKELEFFGVSEDTVKSLTEKKISNDDIEFLYQLIPIISNVNLDVEFTEFQKMCKCPSPQFADYIELLLQHFKELYTTTSKLNDLGTNVKNTMSEMGIKLPEPIKEKSTREKLNEVIEELEVTEDLKRYKELLTLKEELEHKLNEEKADE